MKKNIAILSFLPDTGHVMPLLRVASTFDKNKYNIICFLPEECRQLVESFNFSLRSFGAVTDDSKYNVFEKISRHSVFYNIITSYKDLHKKYFKPIAKNIDNKFEHIVKLIKEEKTSLIIADNHMFIDWYRLISNILNIPLVLNYCEGNLRYLKMPVIAYFGISYLSKLFQEFIEKIFFLHKHLDKRVSIKPSRFKEKSLSSSNNALCTITTGIAMLEKKIIDIITNSKKEYIHFPPIPDKRNTRISEKLKLWLDNNDGKPIVFFSMGTIVQLNKNFIKKILKGLLSLDIRILLVISKKQEKKLKFFNNSENIRIENFVPQPKILSHKNIKCFITHSGAGSTQESLIAGKPMLCIPFLFDQPYNSSVISLLKAGIKINKSKVSSKLISKSIKKLLYDPTYWDSAQNIMKQLKKIDVESTITNYIESNYLN